jgi:hypothetical protein
MLLHTKRVGLILKLFSPKPELVEQNVRLAMGAVDKALALEVGGKKVFSRIDILVSADDRFGDSDCGLTADALRLAPRKGVFVSEVRNGDIFCGLLNYGVSHQMRDRIDYSMIMSIGVGEYLVEENVRPMLDALHSGARVTGLALSELAPSILDGRIANTFAIWDTVSLMTIGGFDLRAAKAPKDDRLAQYVRGWSDEKGEVYYQSSGVEEIIPLVRLIKVFGSCIAPIVPVSGAKWVVSDDPEVQKRERAKLGTKTERQMMWALSESVDFSFIKGGVIPEYRSL